MTNIPWSSRVSAEASVPREIDVPECARQIAEAVAGLQLRRDELGLKKAFDPNDSETTAAFKKLWEVAFPDPPYSPGQQETILKELNQHHRGIVPAMREISHFSEFEMEKGFGANAIRRAQAATPLSSDMARAHLRFRKFAAMEPSARERLMHDADEAIYQKIRFVDRLTEDFPYHTYEAMGHQESQMMTFLDGVSPNVMFRRPYLIIEGGALPFEAIYSSITRLGGEVVVTNRDPEAHATATAFIHQLERLGVLDRGAVRAIHCAPEQIKGMDWRQVTNSAEQPFAALITQRIRRAREATPIMKMLKERGIDTVLTRSAHGLVQLLYEPESLVTLGKVLPHRLSTIPLHSDSTARDSEAGAQVIFPRRMCYNTTRVFSTHPLHHNWRGMAEATDHMFCTRENPRALV